MLIGLLGDFNGEPLTPYLPLGTPASFAGRDYFETSVTGSSWEFDPGNTVHLQVNRSDSTGEGQVFASFNGYLTDTP